MGELAEFSELTAGDRTQRVIRVFHVDDEPEFLSLTSDFLARENDRFDISTETNADDALERLQHDEFDCVVSDYQMPNTDGLEFLKSVREDSLEIPFILFTGEGSEDIASEAISAGVTDYLQKGGPERFSMLANRIVNAVERHQALRQIELSHRAMETANEGISLVESDGTFSYVNPAFGDLFGYDPGELIGEHWTVLYHNAEAERLENDILPAVSEHGYWSGETVRLTKNGQRLVTDHRLAATAADAIVCTAQDVTPSRLVKSEGRIEFGLLFDSLEDKAFYTLDHEGYITRCYESAERLKGYSASEVLGEHIAVFFTEEDRDAGVPEQLIATAKEQGSVSDSRQQLMKDGSRFWADIKIAARYDEAGTIRGFEKVTEEAAEAVTAD